MSIDKDQIMAYGVMSARITKNSSKKTVQPDSVSKSGKAEKKIAEAGVKTVR